jgi:hypothetical protein
MIWIHWLLFFIFNQLWIAVKLVCRLFKATTGSLLEASTALSSAKVPVAVLGVIGRAAVYHSLTHSWSRTLLEKPPIVHLLKNFPAFYGTRSFITVFARALHRSLSRARWIQPVPSHPVSLRSILILSTHLRLGHLSGSILLAFPPISYIYSSSPIRATCPVHLILLDLITVIILGEEYKL